MINRVIALKINSVMSKFTLKGLLTFVQIRPSHTGLLLRLLVHQGIRLRVQTNKFLIITQVHQQVE